ncbi:hypothetical protein ALT_1973 [Aspergillus lentulus]|uniref:Uncharacterized protein n=1 Tax=Aspergillus lentulus TaxID=293939 RepID=A0AAN5YPD1_ASPLE|nr:uncharacterized protein IFM58399_03591 [Aspergillus lentulus]KAF4158359.1 hypothetical protein CNMCM6069_004292 [Aspergillus lentulus]KAF4166392.1 hypothetical protein CNMCM6936_006592 [Aspergillus lentulus]KAF4204848.1 hypothetical protein CNMCM8927_007000 [Aspergillus lentulus]GAQ04652.1 hypothetical protein ALT_1973 [Aspergillus lentulus]GFF33587.1 hypothetical protein IFM58399_03591 [Aspergillus lentulus]
MRAAIHEYVLYCPSSSSVTENPPGIHLAADALAVHPIVYDLDCWLPTEQDCALPQFMFSWSGQGFRRRPSWTSPATGISGRTAVPPVK